MYLAYAARLLGRAFPLILLTSLAGLLLAMGLVRQIQTWSTSAEVLVVPTASNNSVRAPQPERFFRTQVRSLVNDQVMADAARRLGQGTTSSDLRGMLQLEGGADSDILVITMTAPEEDLSVRQTRALLASLGTARSTSVTTRVLSVGEPSPNFPELRALAAGTLGAGFLATLGVLMWGAARRPILAPQHVTLRDPKVVVYPISPTVGDGRWHLEGKALLSWLARRGAPVVVVPDLATNKVAQSLVVGLRELAGPDARLTFVDGTSGEFDAADPDASSSRLLMHVARRYHTTEAQVETQAQANLGLADNSVLVVAKRRRNASRNYTATPTATSRRASRARHEASRFRPSLAAEPGSPSAPNATASSSVSLTTPSTADVPLTTPSKGSSR